MLTSKMGKGALVACAVAGLGVIASTTADAARSADACAAQAMDVARDNHPHRGLIGGLVMLPFETTSAITTGRTSHGFEWKRVYDAAFAACMRGRPVAVIHRGPRYARQ